MPSPGPSKLLWVNKTAQSSSLSHSDGAERIQVFSQAQRTTRSSSNPRTNRARAARRRQDLPAHASTSTADEQILQAAPPAPRSALDLDPAISADERRAIDFYRTVTLTKIQVNDENERTFWQTDVLSLTKHFPPFKHLVAAIAATHEVLVSPEAARRNIFALEQCTKAAQMLRECTARATPALLITSCVLFSAYNLLRGDLENTDRSVAAGWRLASQASVGDPGYLYSYHGDLAQLLTFLDFRHGYRLWAADVAFKFERVPLRDNILVIEPSCVRGPFIDFEQAVDAHKALSTDVIAKIIRNLGIGAYIDPAEPVSQEIFRQFGLFSFHWERYYSSLSEDNLGQRLDALALRAASLNIYLLFRNRVVCRDELTSDSDPHVVAVRQRLINLIEEILAQKAGRHMKYFGQFVMGTLWSVGLYTLHDTDKRRIANLLRSVTDSDDGLKCWLCGTIIIMIADLEKHRKEVNTQPETMASDRIVLFGYSYRDHDKQLVLDYGLHYIDEHVERKQHSHSMDHDIYSTKTPDEIDACLKDVAAWYQMFGKPLLADHQHARPMYYQERLIHVYHGEKTIV